MRIVAVRARDPVTIAARAAEVAQWAAAHDRTTVFCSPMATFASNRGATMANMRNRLAISVDVDNADPREALRVLSAISALGPPMVIVHTGSVWMDPRTDELVPKAHFHWRLSAPTTAPAEHDRLHAVRRLAAE